MRLAAIPHSTSLLNADEVKTIETGRGWCVTHASTLQGPSTELPNWEARPGLGLLCVDAAQTAGAAHRRPFVGIDLLAFSGHKSLFGPQGTGGLYIGPGLEQRLRPLMYGGTGSRSEHEAQPDFLPDKYEAGTPNTIGIAGLVAGVRFVLSLGLDKIRQHEEALTALFLRGLAALRGITVYGPPEAAGRTAVVSFNMAGVSPSEAALDFDERFGILCRPGLHCAPAAHRTIGTLPRGTIRFGFGYFNREEEIDIALKAIEAIGSR